jgi:hypothetical protein
MHIKGKKDEGEGIMILLDESIVSEKILQAFSKFSRMQNILSKDLLIMQSNNLKEEIDKLDSTYAAVQIKFVNKDDTHSIRGVFLQFETATGNLPNFDLFSCVNKILEIHQFKVKFQNMKIPFLIFFNSLLRRIYWEQSRNFLMR